MSYFVCGIATVSPEPGPSLNRKEHAFSFFVHAGAKRKLTIRLGPQQLPAFVLEILGCTEESTGQIPFLITATTASDNSEGLLFPEGAHLASKEYRAHLLGKLQDIESVIRNCIASGFFGQISMFFSSSFQERYEEKYCSPDEIASTAYEELRMKSWFASFKLIVRGREPTRGQSYVNDLK
jgi:hypothetical protein